MAQRPELTNTINNGKGLVSAANTNRDGTGTIVTLLTAGSNGTLIRRISIKADGRPADSCVLIYLYDGSSYYVFDEFDLGAPAAPSATVSSYQDTRGYTDIKISSGWSVRASITAAPTSGAVHVLVFGENF